MSGLNERRFLSVRRAAALLAVTLVVGLLLAAQPLRSGARDMSSPALRGVVMAVTWPLAAVNSALHIDGVRQWALSTPRSDDAAASDVTGTTATGQPPVSSTTAHRPRANRFPSHHRSRHDPASMLSIRCGCSWSGILW